MSLTKASYSMITGTPVNVIDYIPPQYHADIFAGTSSVDVSSYIQDAIDYASNLFGLIPADKRIVASVVFPTGRYTVATTLNNGVDDPRIYCNLIGIGNPEIYHTGTAACLRIGEIGSFGVTQVEVQNLTFSRANQAAGTYAIEAINAGYCYIYNVGINQFDVGLYFKGVIGGLINGCRRFNTATAGVYLESYQPAAPTIRYASNMVTVENYHFGGTGVAYGVIIKVGAGVTPGGSGGNIQVRGCLFEGLQTGLNGAAILVQQSGEFNNSLNQLDTVRISQCWFEQPGDRALAVESSNVSLEYCFFGPQSGAQLQWILALDQYCSINLNYLSAYESALPLVDFPGTMTQAEKDAVKSRITTNYFRAREGYFLDLHPEWETTNFGIRPVMRKEYAFQLGNVDTTSIDLAAKVNALFGSKWTHADFTIVAQVNVAAANCGRATFRVYNNNLNAFYPVGVLDAGTSTAYSLSGSTVTFATGATTVSWVNSIGIWECHSTVGQY